MSRVRTRARRELPARLRRSSRVHIPRPDARSDGTLHLRTDPGSLVRCNPQCVRLRDSARQRATQDLPRAWDRALTSRHPEARQARSVGSEIADFARFRTTHRERLARAEGLHRSDRRGVRGSTTTLRMSRSHRQRVRQSSSAGLARSDPTRPETGWPTQTPNVQRTSLRVATLGRPPFASVPFLPEESADAPRTQVPPADRFATGQPTHPSTRQGANSIQAPRGNENMLHSSINARILERNFTCGTTVLTRRL